MDPRKVMALLGLVTLLLSLLPLSAAMATPPGQDPLDKIEPLVRQELAAHGQTDYFIWLAEKADLSPAERLQTKAEKGRFVYETLRATAERTQAPLRTYLDAQGVDYQAFYIANKVLVRGGDEALLLAIAARPDVAQITANHVIHLDEPFISPNPPPHVEAVEPNISFVNADQVWALGYTGQGTVLAGNDTGLDETHPAIAPHYRGCLDPPACTTWDHNYNWWDATGTFPSDPWDDHMHGTYITGLMVGDDGGANQIGVAPGAQTIHCKNMNQDGSGQEAWFVECFQWDLAPWDLSGLNPDPAMAPDAVNNSWGYSGGDNPAYEDEIAALRAAGILVEVSAGNEGPACATLRSPADYRQVLTTGSVDHAGGVLPGTLTGFSSRGPSALYPDPPDYFPDVMAPGENIRSSFPGGSYFTGSGTSASGPHTVGLAGLLWSACPNLRGKVAPTVQIIQYTAVPLTGQGGSNCGGDYVTGPNNDWGHGTIDALAAVQEALAQCNNVSYLDGHVYDASSGLPITWATVTGDRAEGGFWIEGTDAAGYYTVTALAGTYTVTAGAFGYFPAEVTGILVITDQVTTQDFSLTAMPTYVVSGTVTGADSGAPLSATVTVRYTPLPPAQTDPASGFYSITVPSGTHTFLAEARGYYPQERIIVADRDQTQDFTLAPLYFLPYQGNPVLRGGAPGSWDADIFSPYAVMAGEVYHLFYTGAEDFGSEPMAIGYATSTDGLSFTRAISSPILAGDGTGFDAYMVAGPAVLREDGIWVLYYEGQDTPVPYPEATAIGVATATTPAGPWNRLEDPVLPPGPPGDWDSASVALASVVSTADGYVMYYTGFRLPFPQLQGFMIGMATSTDGITWTKYDDPSTVDPPYAASDPVLTLGPAPWDARAVFGSDVRRTGAGWEMFYTGIDEPVSAEAIGYATSADGIHWHKHAGNPVLEPQHDPLAGMAVDHPTILVNGSAYAMYYSYGWANMISLATGTVCMPVVEAVFDWAPFTPTIGQPVTFTAGASGSDPVTFTWALGNGDWGGGQVISTVYTLPGTYTVILTATNCQTGMATATHTLTVLPELCVPVSDTDFTWLPITPTVGQAITFTGMATGTQPITYSWALGNGNWGEGQVITTIYSLPGVYTVVLTATNCQTASDSIAHTLTVVACVPLEGVNVEGPGSLWVREAATYTATYFPLTATAPVAFSWSNGTVGPTAAYSWTVPGTYTVTVTATNPCTMVRGERVVEVRPLYRVYLPLVTRGW